MANKILISTNDSKLYIKIVHHGLQGKFKDGTLKLIYILLGIHIVNSILFFGSTLIPFSQIYNLLFSFWEISFIYLILYSYFGFTSLIIDCENFKIEKGIGKIVREVNGKTANIKKIKINPVEVFRGQYKSYLFGFSSAKNASYACYLLSNTEYCFGAMCDRQELEQIMVQIDNYLNELPNQPDLLKRQSG